MGLLDTYETTEIQSEKELSTKVHDELLSESKRLRVMSEIHCFMSKRGKGINNKYFSYTIPELKCSLNVIGGDFRVIITDTSHDFQLDPNFNHSYLMYFGRVYGLEYLAMHHTSYSRGRSDDWPIDDTHRIRYDTLLRKVLSSLRNA